jgi:hypothetical protein
MPGPSSHAEEVIFINIVSLFFLVLYLVIPILHGYLAGQALWHPVWAFREYWCRHFYVWYGPEKYRKLLPIFFPGLNLLVIIKKLKTTKRGKILKLRGFHHKDIYRIFISRLTQGDERVKSRVEKSEKCKYQFIPIRMTS